MNFKLPSMFKTPNPRQFDYKPIYYDEAKEDAIGSRQSASGRKYFSSFPTNQRSRIKSNIRLIIILIALMALAYYIIKF